MPILVKKTFTLDTLNHRIEAFSYNDVEKPNIPRQIKLEKKVQQKKFFLAPKKKLLLDSLYRKWYV